VIDDNELIDTRLRAGLRDLYTLEPHYAPRVPRETFSERHAVLMLGLCLLGFWALTVAGVWFLVKH
jgi:hypothetical protein